MAACKADDRSFIRYQNKLKKQFGKVAVVVYNAAYHDSGRVRRYLKKKDDFARLVFLPPYSPFSNPAQWPWRNGWVGMRSTFKRPANSYFRRKVMFVRGSLETKFEPRNILFRSLDRILPA